MTDLLMVLKTQNLKNDQRVLKELNSLTRFGAKPEIFVARDCDTPKSHFDWRIFDVSLIGGASAKNKLLQAIGLLQFYSSAIKFIMKKNYRIIWICDPILFLLVFMVRKFKSNAKIVWDHHELPPNWFLENKILMHIFKQAYLAADINIHANKPRKEYIENKMNCEKKSGYIISNYPDSNIQKEQLLDKSMEEWLSRNDNFIYLQNSLQENRYGAQVIRAALNSGLKIFHAGRINEEYLKKYSLYDKDLYLAGYLNTQQINRVLNKSEFTVILYKQDSINQIYCDANRLYQAMALGVPIVIGSNPTLIDSTCSYPNTYILDDITTDNLVKLFGKIMRMSNNRVAQSFSWYTYDNFFMDLLK